jgi:hypothetical protein
MFGDDEDKYEDKYPCLKLESKLRSQRPSDQGLRHIPRGYWERLKVVVLCGVMVSLITTGLKVRGLKLGRGLWIFKGYKNPQNAFLRTGSKAERFYGMLKIPAEYGRDTASAKFKDISRQLPVSLLDIPA